MQSGLHTEILHISHIIHCVFVFLDDLELFQIERVSKLFNKESRNSILWKKLFCNAKAAKLEEFPKDFIARDAFYKSRKRNHGARLARISIYKLLLAWSFPILCASIIVIWSIYSMIWQYYFVYQAMQVEGEIFCFQLIHPAVSKFSTRPGISQSQREALYSVEVKYKFQWINGSILNGSRIYALEPYENYRLRTNYQNSWAILSIIENKFKLKSKIPVFVQNISGAEIYSFLIQEVNSLPFAAGVIAVGFLSIITLSLFSSNRFKTTPPVEFSPDRLPEFIRWHSFYTSLSSPGRNISNLNPDGDWLYEIFDEEHIPAKIQWRILMSVIVFFQLMFIWISSSIFYHTKEIEWIPKGGSLKFLFLLALLQILSYSFLRIALNLWISDLICKNTRIFLKHNCSLSRGIPSRLYILQELNENLAILENISYSISLYEVTDDEPLAHFSNAILTLVYRTTSESSINGNLQDSEQKNLNQINHGMHCYMWNVEILPPISQPASSRRNFDQVYWLWNLQVRSKFKLQKQLSRNLFYRILPKSLDYQYSTNIQVL